MLYMFYMVKVLKMNIPARGGGGWHVYVLLKQEAITDEVFRYVKYR